MSRMLYDKVINLMKVGEVIFLFSTYVLEQCFSTARPRPGTRPWCQLYRAVRGLRKLQYATRFH